MTIHEFGNFLEKGGKRLRAWISIFEIPPRTLHHDLLYASRNISDIDNFPSGSLILPAGGGRSTIVGAVLNRCKTLAPFTELLAVGDAAELADCETGSVTSVSSVIGSLSIIGSRIQCRGKSDPSRRFGNNFARSGRKANKHAQIIPTLASTADQMIAQTPEIIYSPSSDIIPTVARRATLIPQTKKPSKKTMTMLTFCLRGRCRRAMAGIGRPMMRKSRPISTAATEVQ